VDCLIITDHQPITIACKHFFDVIGLQGRRHCRVPSSAWMVNEKTFPSPPQVVILDIDTHQQPLGERLYQELVSGELFGTTPPYLLLTSHERLNWPFGIWLKKPFNLLQLHSAWQQLHITL